MAARDRQGGQARGRIAIHDPVGAAIQRELLEEEGVAVGDTGLVALDAYGWLPTTARRSEPPKHADDYSRIRPRRIASTTASVRVEAPSFIITPLTWNFAV